MPALRWSTPVELIDSGRRVLAKKVHRDAGGDEEAMKALNAAAHLLLGVIHA